jgi:hypothetical protein
MSQFRVKGSAVRLIAAGAQLKLLAEDSGTACQSKWSFVLVLESRGRGDAVEVKRERKDL